jgi:hypothetical protein
VAREGEPVELDVALQPVVSTHVEPAGAVGEHGRRAVVSEMGSSYRRKIALVAGGAGLAATAGAIVLGLQSQQLDHDASALCPSPLTPCPDASTANDLNLRARARAFQANVGFGVAGGAAIAAAVLWLTATPESRVAITPRLGAVAGVDLAGRF